MTEPITYADSGVDIEKANSLVSAINRITRQTKRPGVLSEIGGFAGLFSIAHILSNMKHPVLVSSTDGVGTKLKIAFMLDRHDTVGIDLVAAGDIDADGKLETVVHTDAAQKTYRKLVIRDNLLVGAILLGDIRGSAEIQAAIKKQRDVSLLKGELAQPDFDFKRLS